MLNDATDTQTYAHVRKTRRTKIESINWKQKWKNHNSSTKEKQIISAFNIDILNNYMFVVTSPLCISHRHLSTITFVCACASRRVAPRRISIKLFPFENMNLMNMMIWILLLNAHHFSSVCVYAEEFCTWMRGGRVTIEIMKLKCLKHFDDYLGSSAIYFRLSVIRIPCVYAT